ncbi:cation transporter [Rugamonas sp. CCM 8940]|nr:cation diffusion facilitator family transporter [Rugamonas sp. CCM 8940]MBJ7308892.1 cation transporter [Rugamonas sp. CCM 8940]
MNKQTHGPDHGHHHPHAHGDEAHQHDDHAHEHKHAAEAAHGHGQPAAGQAKPAAKGCGHQHGHSHGHGHHHHGDPNSHGRAFAIAIVLNTLFVGVEFGYGFIANSTALMADAGHNLSDVLGLMLAWGAAILAKRAPNQRYTYGLRGTSMLAALFNAMLLMAACGAIAWEAVQQLLHPNPVAGLTVSLVAAVGIAINGFSAWLFLAGSKDDINIRGAYLHLAADAAISLGVLLAGLVVMATGWSWLDPLVSMAIVALIVWSTWSLLHESLRLVLAAVPDNVDAPGVEQFLRQQAGVSGVHDLHIWAMSTTETALTAHLVMPDGHPGDDIVDSIGRRLKDDFAIHHSTLQIEHGTTSHACCLTEPAPAPAAGHGHAH